MLGTPYERRRLYTSPPVLDKHLILGGATGKQARARLHSNGRIRELCRDELQKRELREEENSTKKQEKEKESDRKMRTGCER